MTSAVLPALLLALSGQFYHVDTDGDGDPDAYQWLGTAEWRLGTQAGASGQCLCSNGSAASPTWQTVSGSGGISGPGSSTDNAITRWDGTGGTAVQNSTLLVDDSGYIGRTAASGTDQAGSDFRASAGAGTGAGTPGLAYLSTPLALASGTTVQTIIDRFILGGSGTQSTVLLGNPDTDNQVTTPMDAQILATDANSTNAAGDLLIRAGNAYSNASGGNLTLQSGSTLSAFGFGSSAGDIILECGDASDSNVTDGSLIVRTRGTDRLEIAPAGDWIVDGTAGTSGYALVSNGAGASPTWQAVAGGGGGAGTTTCDFGTYPGDNDCTVTITGETGILSGSVVQAWIYPADTADHTLDEHLYMPIRVFAHSIVAGTGFTITAIYDPVVQQEAADSNRGRAQLNRTAFDSYASPRTYGLWSVAWRWQ